MEEGKLMPNLPRDLILGFAVAALALYAGIVTIQHNRLQEVYQTTMQSAIANVLWDVAICESGLRHDAKNGGAFGLFQFKEKTFDWMRDRGREDRWTY
jgi:hypothetical protein